MLNVYAIFDSIQGESTYQGVPMTFIRLAGCPLSCRYCDTRAACESAGSPMSVASVIARVSETGLESVEVTGGEPLYQAESLSLLRALADRFENVLLETSGAFPIHAVDPRVHIVMDVKCPGSGMADRFIDRNLAELERFRHDVKFVLTDEDDFDWAADYCDAHGLWPSRPLFSPVHGAVEAASLARWMMARRAKGRLQLQLHKLIWPDAAEER